MIKKLPVLLGVILLLLTSNSALAYTDVSSVDKNYTEINFLENFNLFEGSEFDADAVITKGELFYYLLKIDNFDVSKAKEMGRSFVDLSPEDEPYFQRMYELGVFDYDNTTVYANAGTKLKNWNALNYFFKYHGIPVQRLITNDEFIKSKLDGIYLNSIFAPYIDRALQMGLIKPINRQYDVFGDFTRRDLAKLVYNYYQYLANNSTGGNITINIQNAGVNSSLNQVEQFKIFEDVWNRANNEFLYSEDLEKDKLMYGAIDGLVEAMNDPYTTFLIPAENQSLQDSLADSYEGIGASLHYENGKIIVVSPISNSPAEKAGLLPGDQIISVDGVDVTGMNLDEATALIKGEAGTSVVIGILRDGETYRYSMTRSKVEIKYVTAEQTLDNILILRVNTFGSGTLSNIEAILKQIDQSKVNGVIIDVRNNPGGYLDQAVKVAEVFLDKGESVVEVDYKNKTNELYKSSKDGALRGVPLAVLINKGSASASEILAGALQANANAKLVGETSFGKGTVQELVNYSDQSSLKITTAEWKVPSEFGFKSINKVGISPNFYTEITDEDREIGNDSQLNKAIQILRGN